MPLNRKMNPKQSLPTPDIMLASLEIQASVMVILQPLTLKLPVTLQLLLMLMVPP